MPAKMSVAARRNTKLRRNLGWLTHLLFAHIDRGSGGSETKTDCFTFWPGFGGCR
jgi:hypothetical protein